MFLRLAKIEWQVENHLWIVTLRLIVRVASWMVGDMRKEGLVSGTIIVVGGILDWGNFILDAEDVFEGEVTRWLEQGSSSVGL